MAQIPPIGGHKPGRGGSSKDRRANDWERYLNGYGDKDPDQYDDEWDEDQPDDDDDERSDDGNVVSDAPAVARRYSKKFKPLDPNAPDPPWMVKARQELGWYPEGCIKIRPGEWERFMYQRYAPFVFHLGRAIDRELQTKTRQREVRVFYPEVKDRKDHWLWRIEIDILAPREFTLTGWVDHGDYHTPPFFRELTVTWITKNAYLPSRLWERHGELVSTSDFCVSLNEWPEGKDHGVGGRRTRRGARKAREARGAGGRQSRAGVKKETADDGARTGPTLLDLLHKFVPPPRWWRGYCSPFKEPYSLWFEIPFFGPLPRWAERKLYHPKSTEWPWLPEGEARARMHEIGRRRWKNRTGYRKADGIMEEQLTVDSGQLTTTAPRPDTRHLTPGTEIPAPDTQLLKPRAAPSRPRHTDARDKDGVWVKPYSASALKLHRREDRWKPSREAPECVNAIAGAKPGEPIIPIWLTSGRSGIPRYTTEEALSQPGPWPRWKIRRKLPPKRGKPGRPRARSFAAVYRRYLRIEPALRLEPLMNNRQKQIRAHTYRLFARLVPTGENLHLAELLEFERELLAALKHSLKHWRRRTTTRVKERDKVRTIRNYWTGGVDSSRKAVDSRR